MKTYSYQVTEFLKNFKTMKYHSDEKNFSSENLAEARKQAFDYHQKRLSELLKIGGFEGERFPGFGNSTGMASFRLVLNFVISENEEETKAPILIADIGIDEAMELEMLAYEELGLPIPEQIKAYKGLNVKINEQGLPEQE